MQNKTPIISKKYIIFLIGLCLILWTASPATASVSVMEMIPATEVTEETETSSDKTSNRGHLIQTVSDKEEYEGMLHLGLFRTAASKNMEEAIANVKSSVTEIQIGDYRGSGSIFSMDETYLYVTTSKHLLIYGVEAQVTFYQGNTFTGEVLGVSTEADMGVIRVKAEYIPIHILRNLRYVATNPERSQNLEAGEEMFLVGSADGVAKNFYMGVVANPWEYFPEFGSFMIRNFCEGKPGMSGSGTFDQKGIYIGMLTGGSGEETASIPLSVMLEEYEKILDGTS